jgi:RHS repeat-associated protein
MLLEYTQHPFFEQYGLLNAPGINKTSMQVESIETYTGENITYIYDELGNVIHMDTDDGIYDYEYDFMGRLTKEFNPVLNQTIVITYDKQNIAYKKYYAGKTSTLVKQMEFLTNNENQLLYVGTTENGNETPLSIGYGSSYLGNPTSIGTKSLTWEGRRLKAIPSDNISYTYNEQGIRTTKNVNGDITTYYLKGSNIIAEKINQVTTFFNYNEQDELIGFEYDNNQYFYVRDLLGKITEVIDFTGLTMVSYKYDAWGNWINKTSASNGTSLGDTLVAVNPFIYKGYYYDSETDWYYLKSRYYSPLLSRFINMDNTNYLEPGSVAGVNLFAYCNNDPVMGFDPNGNFSFKKLWGKVKGTVKKVVNKVVDYFLEKADIKRDYGFGFIENQIRTGGIDKIWNSSWKNGEGTVTMWSPLNLLGIDSTINISLGLTSENGLYFGLGHSMETGDGVVTTTWGTRIVPYAFAAATVKVGKHIKDKVESVDWGVIGRKVAIGAGIVVGVAAVAVVAWFLAVTVPGLLPVLAKFAGTAAASYIVFLNL